MNDVLPALPRSDGYALERNIYDGFYKVKARDFWGKNKIVQEQVKDFEKCEHKFHVTKSGCECQKCHMGLIGPGLEVQDGRLLYKGKPLEL